MGRPRAQRRPGAAEEQAAGPGQRDQPKHHAGPAEQLRVLGLDPGEQAAVQGEGQGHHVARAGRRDADADQEPLVLLPPQRPGPRVLGRMRRIAQRVQRPGDAGERHLIVIPAHAHQRPPQIQPGLDHAGHDLRQLLDQPHAGGAVDALQVQFGGLRPVGERPGSTVPETPDRRIRRTGDPWSGPAAATPPPPSRNSIEAVQAAAVDHGVDRAAAVAAELLARAGSISPAGTGRPQWVQATSASGGPGTATRERGSSDGETPAEPGSAIALFGRTRYVSAHGGNTAAWCLGSLGLVPPYRDRR